MQEKVEDDCLGQVGKRIYKPTIRRANGQEQEQREQEQRERDKGENKLGNQRRV